MAVFFPKTRDTRSLAVAEGPRDGLFTKILRCPVTAPLGVIYHVRLVFATCTKFRLPNFTIYKFDSGSRGPDHFLFGVFVIRRRVLRLATSFTHCKCTKQDPKFETGDLTYSYDHTMSPFERLHSYTVPCTPFKESMPISCTVSEMYWCCIGCVLIFTHFD